MVKKKSAAKKKAVGKKVVTKKKKVSAKKKAKPVKKKATPKKSAVKKAKPSAKPKAKSKAKAKTKVKKKAPTRKKAPPIITKKAALKKTVPKKKAPQKVVQKKSAPKKARVVAKSPKRIDPVVVKIQERLLENRKEVLKMLESSQAMQRDVEGLTFSNEIDLASSLEGREMVFQLSSRDRRELKLIDDALIKIKGGSYGTCESCGKKITTKRLQILPLTTLCIECKESAENL